MSSSSSAADCPYTWRWYRRKETLEQIETNLLESKGRFAGNIWTIIAISRDTISFVVWRQMYSERWDIRLVTEIERPGDRRQGPWLEYSGPMVDDSAVSREPMVWTSKNGLDIHIRTERSDLSIVGNEVINFQIASNSNHFEICGCATNQSPFCIHLSVCIWTTPAVWNMERPIKYDKTSLILPTSQMIWKISRLAIYNKSTLFAHQRTWRWISRTFKDSRCAKEVISFFIHSTLAISYSDCVKYSEATNRTNWEMHWTRHW